VVIAVIVVLVSLYAWYKIPKNQKTKEFIKKLNLGMGNQPEVEKNGEEEKDKVPPSIEFRGLGKYQDKDRSNVEVLSTLDLPEPLDCESVLNGDQPTMDEFCLRMKNKGYAIIRIDDHRRDIGKQLGMVTDKFFNETSFEEKKNMMEPDRNNLGYVHVQSVREYIKLRTTDPPNLWPKSEEFKQIFNEFFETFYKIAEATFVGFSNHFEEEKEDVLIPEENLDAIKSFIHQKSSVSIIKYFPHDEEPEKCVCAEHKDTGLMTYILNTGVPSLQIYDKEIDKYVRIEDISSQNDLIVFFWAKRFLCLLLAIKYTLVPLIVCI